MKDEEIKKLLLQYNGIIKTLKDNGVIKSSKIVGEYGEYIASKMLDLTLESNPSNKGYDATGKDGRYQIKTRKDNAWNRATIFPIETTKLTNVDFVIYVGLDENWNVAKLLKIPKADVNVNSHNRVVITRDLVKSYNILEK